MNDRSLSWARAGAASGGRGPGLGSLGFVLGGLSLLAAGCEGIGPMTLELPDLLGTAGSDLGDGGASGGDLATKEPRPPDPSLSAVEAFLNAGTYKQWKCEPRPVTRIDGLPRAHGATNRICNNSLVANTAGTPFPVDAASVKELYNAAGTTITGYAVAIRLATGEGGSNRYWYEKNNGALFADGQGVALCTNCHVSAPRDFTYIVAQ